MTKHCPSCALDKPTTEFAPNRSRSDGLQAQCRACYAAYQRDYYRRRTATDEEYRSRQQGLRQQRRDRRKHLNRLHVMQYLSTHPCVDCGESDPIVLEFDPVDPATKSFAIGDGIFWKPWREIAREIEACEVRCANCHRRRTARQRGWYTYLDHGT